MCVRMFVCAYVCMCLRARVCVRVYVVFIDLVFYSAIQNKSTFLETRTDIDGSKRRRQHRAAKIANKLVTT